MSKRSGFKRSASTRTAFRFAPAALTTHRQEPLELLREEKEAPTPSPTFQRPLDPALRPATRWRQGSRACPLRCSAIDLMRTGITSNSNSKTRLAGSMNRRASLQMRLQGIVQASPSRRWPIISRPDDLSRKASGCWLAADRHHADMMVAAALPYDSRILAFMERVRRSAARREKRKR